MNVKIKANGVSCLVGDDYDRVYAALKSNFGDGSDQLFTERTPGHEYLQWELPGDGWVSLAEGDPLMVQEVERELLVRKQAVSNRFKNNQGTAQKILSVPDDSYVYYKAGTDGQLLIRLTAWGYRYPERVGGGDITTGVEQKEKEHVVIRAIYDGKPLPDKTIFVKGLKRQTDATGAFTVGDLPLGYQFDVKVDDQQKKITVQKGDGNIDVDVTVFTTVEVIATKDGQPYAGAEVSLAYINRNLKLNTDSTGKTSLKVPLDMGNGMCTVSVDSDYQQMPLVKPLTVFKFNLKSPEPEKPDEEPETDQHVDAPSEDKPAEEIVPPEEKQEEPVDVSGKEPVETMEEPIENEHPDVIEEQKDVAGEQPNDPPKEDEQKSEPEEKTGIGTILGEVLAALSVLALVVYTYLFCLGMLVA